MILPATGIQPPPSALYIIIFYCSMSTEVHFLLPGFHPTPHPHLSFVLFAAIFLQGAWQLQSVLGGSARLWLILLKPVGAWDGPWRRKQMAQKQLWGLGVENPGRQQEHFSAHLAIKNKAAWVGKRIPEADTITCWKNFKKNLSGGSWHPGESVSQSVIIIQCPPPPTPSVTI